MHNANVICLLWRTSGLTDRLYICKWRCGLRVSFNRKICLSQIALTDAKLVLQPLIIVLLGTAIFSNITPSRRKQIYRKSLMGVETMKETCNRFLSHYCECWWPRILRCQAMCRFSESRFYIWTRNRHLTNLKNPIMYLFPIPQCSIL